jgi:hypothetical protein
MTSLKITVLSGLGVAIAAGLSLGTPISAQPVPQQKASAAALGGPLLPSNPYLFQAQAKPADPTIKIENKEQTHQLVNAPLDWQSEHLDEQRQFDNNFSIINVDLD